MAKKILTKVHELMRLKHYSYRTEKSYIYWMKKFYYFHNKKDPKTMNGNHIEKFLTYLAVDQKVSASTQNQALNALCFLYKKVLKKEIDFNNFKRVKRKRNIPVILSKEEIDKIFSFLYGKYLLVSQILYSSGLRLFEALSLRVKDVDFKYLQIIVRSGKGDKDRRTILPEKLILPLKKQIEYRRKIHEKDLNYNNGYVDLPYRINKKYPNASKEFI